MAEPLSAAEIAKAARRAGFEGDDLVTAVAVALAESSGNPRAVNATENPDGSVDRGLWQINSVHGLPAAQLLTVDGNAKAARQVFEQAGGWGPWYTWKDGLHRKFLPEARKAAGRTDCAKLTNPLARRLCEEQQKIEDERENPTPDPPAPGSEIADRLSTVLRAVQDREFWGRAGKVTVGGVLVLVGLVVMSAPGAAAGTVQGALGGAAASVLPGGPAVQLVGGAVAGNTKSARSVGRQVTRRARQEIRKARS